MRLLSHIQRLWEAVDIERTPFALNYSLCPICGEYNPEYNPKRTGGICENCLSLLNYTYSWLMPVTCPNLTLFEHILPLCYYSDGLLRSSIFQMKYHAQFPIATAYGRMLGTFLQERGFASYFDAVVPVPLHWRRRFWRGYNQTTFFATGLSDSLSLPVVDALCRTHKGRSQTKTKSRKNNIRGAFQLTEGAANPLKGKHLLLVDDVLTSGATCLECADALWTIPDVRLSVASIAIRRSLLEKKILS